METITIGNQKWISKNLKVDTFRNGDPIPEAKTDDEWDAARENGQPACCTYNYDPVMGEKYGKLYNWHAVNDPRGLAPVGFHVPSNQDWQELVEFLGGSDKVGKKIKATHDWKPKEIGTDEVGFTGLPGGYANHVGGFALQGIRAMWWSSDENGTDNAWGRYAEGKIWVYSEYRKGQGLSVRCIQD